MKTAKVNCLLLTCSYLTKNKRTLFSFCVVLALLAFLTYIWAWQGSGVTLNSRSFLHPEGYIFKIISPSYGNWWIGKESSFYLLTAQGFLGVPGSTINTGNLYEMYRTFYPLLLRSFWFLDPMEAVLALDLLLWFLACITVWLTAKNLGHSKTTCFFAVFFTIFSQGFLQSVGEGKPTLAGYVSGYFILYLLSSLKPWEKQASLREDIPIYAFVGIWQLVYGTAFLFLPLILATTGWRYYTTKRIYWGQSLLLLILATAPYLTISIIIKSFFGKSGGIAETIITRYGTDYTSLIKTFCWVLLDGFASLGPIAFVGILGLAIAAYKKSAYIYRVLLAMLCCQFLVMSLLLISVPGRGYATFNSYPLLCLGAAILCSKLWTLRTYTTKAVVVLFCIFIICYTNADKVGFMLQTNLFLYGLKTINQWQWWKYELLLFQ